MTVDDMHLVREYVTRQSEAAFATLVSRYTGLVYSAALRQVRNPQLAEEVTQVVFIILARKAGSLGAGTILPSWLYRTACYVSSSALERELRRQFREQKAYMQSTLQDTQPGMGWEQLSPLLDQAMLRLKQADRDALVLRFFEGRSLNEVGAALGSSEEAAKKRVNRALEKLRRVLYKCGVNSTSAAIAEAMAVNSLQVAPVALAGTATAVALAKGATASTSILTLTKGALKIMAWTKAKAGIASVIIASSIAVPLILQHQAEAKLRENDDLLRQQSQQIASAQSENDRLSRATANSELSLGQSNDLQRLRAEVGPLREQASEVAQLQQENRQLRTKTGQDKPRTPLQMKEETIAKLSGGKNWVIAFYQFAEKNQGQFPTNFAQAVAFAPDDLKNDINGLQDRFEIVFQGSPSSLDKPQDVIVLREKDAWNAGATSHPPGKWAKIYTYADGHSEVHLESSDNFDDYEKAHMIVPATSNP